MLQLYRLHGLESILCIPGTRIFAWIELELLQDDEVSRTSGIAQVRRRARESSAVVEPRVKYVEHDNCAAVGGLTPIGDGASAAGAGQ